MSTRLVNVDLKTSMGWRRVLFAKVEAREERRGPSKGKRIKLPKDGPAANGRES